MVNQIRGPIPEGYYDEAAERKVFDAGHFIFRHLVQGFVTLTAGSVRESAPESVYDMPKPGIVAANHRSKKDISVFVTATERVGLHHVRPLAKKELYEGKFFGWFYHAMGSIAVDRENPDMEGIQHAFTSLLGNRENVLYFPEGERVLEDTRRVHDIKRGVVMLSMAAQVPIVPLGVAGTAIDDDRRSFGRGKPIIAVFGDPIPPPAEPEGMTKLEMLRTTRIARHELQDAMQNCLDQAYEKRDNL